MTKEEKSYLKRYSVIMIIRAITNISLTIYTSNLRDDIKNIKEYIENQTCSIDSKVPVEAVDDLVDRRISRFERERNLERNNYKDRLSSDVYYDWDTYDSTMEKCRDIVWWTWYSVIKFENI